MNELDRYARTWGATAVPFGPLSETQWVGIASQQRAWSLLDQTAALRGVMLLSGGNGVGKSTLVGRWVRQLENRLYTPVNLTQATLSSSGLLATLKCAALGAKPRLKPKSSPMTSWLRARSKPQPLLRPRRLRRAI
jgi:hypothetical protein